MKFVSKTIISLFLPLAFCHFVQGGQWVLNFTTASNWMAGYIGDVTVCLHFKPPNVTRNSTVLDSEITNSSVKLQSAIAPAKKDFVKKDCQDLPWRSFQRGQTYSFAIEFAESLALEKVRIFTKPMENYVCKGKSTDAWHIDQVLLHDMVTGMLFEAIFPGNGTVKPVLVHSMCGDKNEELVLDVFKASIQRRPCVIDGVIYQDGTNFELGCSGICKCEDAGFGCVSMCPPAFSEKCRQVYVPGQCCPTFICEKEKPVSCPLYESSDCETANRTVDPEEYPWSAFIKLCNKNGCHRFCSGALLNEQWIITAAECFFWGSDQQPVKPEQMRVIVGEQTIILDEDRDVEIVVANTTVLLPGSRGKTSNFGLIKLKDAVVFDRSVQPAVLPISREQCLQLVRPSCAISLSGWINIGTPDAEQYELYKLSTQVENSSSCTSAVVEPSSPTSPKKRRPPPPPTQSRKENICLNLANDDPTFQPECESCQVDTNSSDACFADKTPYLCTGERGRALVSKVQVSKTEVNYLVGITSYKLRIDESPKGLCKMRAYELAVNICQDLYRIVDLIK